MMLLTEKVINLAQDVDCCQLTCMPRPLGMDMPLIGVSQLCWPLIWSVIKLKLNLESLKIVSDFI